MAAHAEGADRTLSQLLKFLLELVKHRRDCSIGVLRRRPFIIDLLVTLPALRGGGIERLVVDLPVVTLGLSFRRIFFLGRSFLLGRFISGGALQLVLRLCDLDGRNLG